ncbi:MAG: hypothetical protein WB797_09960 [Nocardioides sp.]
MTEQVPPRGPDEQGPEPEAASSGSDEPTASAVPVSSGVPAVDQVLADVDRLDELPLDEHLPAFERAHDALRSALDAEPGDPA